MPADPKPAEPTLTDEECDRIWGRDDYIFPGVDKAAMWYRSIIRSAYSLGLAAGQMLGCPHENMDERNIGGELAADRLRAE